MRVVGVLMVLVGLAAIVLDIVAWVKGMDRLR